MEEEKEKKTKKANSSSVKKTNTHPYNDFLNIYRDERFIYNYFMKIKKDNNKKSS